MWPAFPSSEYYDGSAPSAPSVGIGPIQRPSHLADVLAGTSHGWFPRSRLFGRRVRHPALPLRPRHGYAVDLHHDLPSQTVNTRSGVPHPAEPSPTRLSNAGTHREPAHIHRVRAGDQSRGVTTPVPRVYLPVSLTRPGPSGSPEPTRLCRGCSHLPRRSPDRLPPASPHRHDGRAPKVSHLHPPQVRSTRSALPALPLVGFSGSPPEPGVHLSAHRALHKSRRDNDHLHAALGHGVGMRVPR